MILSLPCQNLYVLLLGEYVIACNSFKKFYWGENKSDQDKKKAIQIQALLKQLFDIARWKKYVWKAYV